MSYLATCALYSRNIPKLSNTKLEIAAESVKKVGHSSTLCKYRAKNAGRQPIAVKSRQGKILTHVSEWNLLSLKKSYAKVNALCMLSLPPLKDETQTGRIYINHESSNIYMNYCKNTVLVLTQNIEAYVCEIGVFWTRPVVYMYIYYLKILILSWFYQQKIAFWILCIWSIRHL